MAARLSAAGGEVDLRVYSECPQRFTSFPTAMASAALNYVECWLADRFLDTHSVSEPTGNHVVRTGDGQVAGSGQSRRRSRPQLPELTRA